MSRLRNRATVDVFEPGSVLKPIAMSAILDEDHNKSFLSIDTSPGWIEYEGFKTSDFRNYGLLTLSELFPFPAMLEWLSFVKIKILIAS